MADEFKPYRARIVFRGKVRPRSAISTIAFHTTTGAVFGTNAQEIADEIKKNYPDVYEYEVVGLDNQRIDWEMIYGMAPADYKFANSYYVQSQ